jgi:hypothetical protein
VLARGRCGCGDLVGCGVLGVVGPDDGGGLGLAGSGGVLLGLFCSGGGVGDQAGGVGAGDTDVMLCIGTRWSALPDERPNGPWRLACSACPGPMVSR